MRERSNPRMQQPRLGRWNLHGGDVLQELLDARGVVPGAAAAAAAGEGEEREESADVGFIAVNLHRRAGAGGRTVQQGAQVLVKENAEEKENLPVAAGERAAQRADSIHALTTQDRRFSGNFAAQWQKK